jgi:hypothetical protein
MQTVYIGNTLVNDVMLGSQRMDDVFTQFTGNDQNLINFLNTTGITNTNTIDALDSLVASLKFNNIWDKLYALYPFVGGTQQTNKYNLIDTGSYLLAFTGSWVYNDNGVFGNGTNTYADTAFTPQSSVSNFVTNGSLGIYTRTDTTSSGYDMGCESGNTPPVRRVYLISKNAANKSSFDISENAISSTADQNGAGLFLANISGSGTNNQKIFRNGTSIASQTNVLAQTVSVPLFIGANNDKNTGANAYVSESFSIASMGKGLTDSEASTYYTLVQNFQTTLGRQV